MKRETDQKLKVLMNVGKLDSQGFSFLKYIDKYVESNYKNADDEMLLIHLSVAISRLSNNESVDKMPNEMWSQIMEKSEYETALSIWNELKEHAPVQFSKDESQYVLLHILNIVSGRN